MINWPMLLPLRKYITSLESWSLSQFHRNYEAHCPQFPPFPSTTHSVPFPFVRKKNTPLRPQLQLDRPHSPRNPRLENWLFFTGRPEQHSPLCSTALTSHTLCPPRTDKTCWGSLSLANPHPRFGSRVSHDILDNGVLVQTSPADWRTWSVRSELAHVVFGSWMAPTFCGVEPDDSPPARAGGQHTHRLSRALPMMPDWHTRCRLWLECIQQQRIVQTVRFFQCPIRH